MDGNRNSYHFRLALCATLLLLFAAPARANIDPSEAPHFMALGPARAGLPQVHSMRTATRTSGNTDNEASPASSNAQAAEPEHVPEKKFFPLNRALLVPVHGMQSTTRPMVTAPLTNRLQPLARPIMSAPLRSTAPSAAPVEASSATSSTLDLFDSGRAPAPMPVNFYRALRDHIPTRFSR